MLPSGGASVKARHFWGRWVPAMAVRVRSLNLRAWGGSDSAGCPCVHARSAARGRFDSGGRRTRDRSGARAPSGCQAYQKGERSLQNSRPACQRTSVPTQLRNRAKPSADLQMAASRPEVRHSYQHVTCCTAHPYQGFGGECLSRGGDESHGALNILTIVRRTFVRRVVPRRSANVHTLIGADRVV